jgi:eukaryotic-like serine/threonine-protein kinase
MSTLPTRNPWPADVAQRLDAICLRFEDAWLAAGADAGPRIEAFLDEASPSERPWLVRELVGLDADYRSRRGEPPPFSEYQRRFPELDLALLNTPPRSDDTHDWPATPGERDAKTPVEDCSPPPGEMPRNAPAPASIPGYEILGVLGRGAMGIVYQARHVGLNRIVALKMILAGGHADAALRERFRVEAQAIARLQHPTIVQVFEVGEHDALPFFSLEYCAGGSLARKLDGTPLPPPEAAALLETLARAMHAAHQRGIIHRDLKPGNGLLASGGCEPPVELPTGGLRPPLAGYVPKITDFGLAKMLDQTGLSQSGQVMGTPSYMPPEQSDPRLGEPGRCAMCMPSVRFFTSA